MILFTYIFIDGMVPHSLPVHLDKSVGDNGVHPRLLTDCTIDSKDAM